MIRTFGMVIMAVLITAGCKTGQNDIALYVSPDGSDDASGIRPGDAFATLERARDTIRARKREGGLNAPVKVYLGAGIHRLEKPLVMQPEDSGTEAYPITWSSFPGETATISGATPITGWTEDANGWWTVSLPAVAAGDWYFNSLFVNGEYRPRTRLPDEGYYTIMDFPNKNNDAWAAPSDWFEFIDGHINLDWHNIEDVEVVVLRFWVSSRQKIANVEENTNTVHFTARTRYRYSDDFTTDGARYYVENIFEALDEPGEWYLDRSTGTLYYYPKEGEDPASTLVEAPVADQLVRIVGDPSQQEYVTNVRFEGILFQQNNWMLPDGNTGDGQSAPEVEGAIYLKGARACAFENNRLVQLSSYGVQIDEGCTNNRFTGNELGNLGGGGFRMGGGDFYSHEAYRTGKNVITDNHIHHIGRIHHAATGVWIQHSGGNTISHNEISNTYYSSIAIGWVWGYRPSVTTHNEISFNHIHHVGQGVLSDMGGIYLLGVAPGTVVRNNLIHDIESHGYGGWGIYTDEGSSHILIENNIVYNTKCAGFDQHYGRENRVWNNIFAMGREDQIHRTRVEEHISFFVERNIVFSRGDSPLLGGAWETRPYLHRPEKPTSEPVTDSLNHFFDYNLYYNPDRTLEDIRFARWSFEEWQDGGQDIHSVYADPMFVNPEEGNFELSPESPAFDLGFQAIDMSTVGPRK